MACSCHICLLRNFDIISDRKLLRKPRWIHITHAYTHCVYTRIYTLTTLVIDTLLFKHAHPDTNSQILRRRMSHTDWEHEPMSPRIAAACATHRKDPGLVWLQLFWPGILWPGVLWPGVLWPGVFFSSSSSWRASSKRRPCQMLTIVSFCHYKLASQKHEILSMEYFIQTYKRKPPGPDSNVPKNTGTLFKCPRKHTGTRFKCPRKHTGTRFKCPRKHTGTRFKCPYEFKRPKT
jgi:hypothetical protein